MPDEFDQEQEPVTRSFWSGTITFGLVSIPVALYAANRSNRVSLRMVSPEGTPLTRRYFTSKDDRELDPDEIVRGYETEKDKFVIVDDEELERLAPERTRDIDLRQFVDASEIDPMYFERAYYLIPNGQSTKAYRLLARVMEETGRAGVATFVMRAKEYLVAILAENGILRAETLRFADELRTPETVGLPEPVKPDAAAVRQMDREIGKRLDDALDVKDLVDHSPDRLLKLVQGKVRAGDDVVHPEERETDGESDIIDLMEILKRRLQGEREEAADTASNAADDDAPRPARKTPAKKTAAKKATAKKAASKTAAAKKPAAKKPAAKTAASKKPAAKTGAAKKAAAKKTASKRATSRRAA
ncbi:MAG TPA: Ku protein [Longimicrobium sp.]|nr:Ku protein [Longimicrobium sp.]